jgi:hypothetical protein
MRVTAKFIYKLKFESHTLTESPQRIEFPEQFALIKADFSLSRWRDHKSKVQSHKSGRGAETYLPPRLYED